jgi:hypothetical protein
MNDFCIDGQATIDEIRMYFNNHNIYLLDANTTAELIVVVAPNGNVLVTFEPIGYEDDDGTPDVYEVYDTNYDDVKFSEVARLWADTIIKLA